MVTFSFPTVVNYCVIDPLAELIAISVTLGASIHYRQADFGLLRKTFYI